MKPMIIRLEEAKTELAQCLNHIINDEGVPCYYLKDMLGNLLAEVQAGAKQELAMAREQMKNEQMKTEEGDK